MSKEMENWGCRLSTYNNGCNVRPIAAIHRIRVCPTPTASLIPTTSPLPTTSLTDYFHRIGAVPDGPPRRTAPPGPEPPGGQRVGRRRPTAPCTEAPSRWACRRHTAPRAELRADRHHAAPPQRRAVGGPRQPLPCRPWERERREERSSHERKERRRREQQGLK